MPGLERTVGDLGQTHGRKKKKKKHGWIHKLKILSSWNKEIKDGDQAYTQSCIYWTKTCLILGSVPLSISTEQSGFFFSSLCCRHPFPQTPPPFFFSFLWTISEREVRASTLVLISSPPLFFSSPLYCHFLPVQASATWPGSWWVWQAGGWCSPWRAVTTSQPYATPPKHASLLCLAMRYVEIEQSSPVIKLWTKSCDSTDPFGISWEVRSVVEAGYSRNTRRRDYSWVTWIIPVMRISILFILYLI